MGGAFGYLYRRSAGKDNTCGEYARNYRKRVLVAKTDVEDNDWVCKIK